MHSGDVLLLYTDGINEAQNDRGEFYGEDRICELIRENHTKTPQEIALTILEEVQHFCANSTYNDDKTIVVIKRDPKEHEDANE
jgi:serine phosphatase RsbU (regulator of sigma subunit)